MTLPRHDAAPARASYQRFTPKIGPLPDLPPVDWAAIGGAPPTPLPAPAGALPAADVVVITWTGAEWAALEHVFLRSGVAMSAAAAHESSWSEWQKYDADMPPYSGHDAEDWKYWGWYSLVEIRGRRVLLFKSNTHLSWPGESYLVAMVQRILQEVKPALLMSIGTAGGARTTDHLGTVNAVNSGTLYSPPAPPARWPTFSSPFAPAWSTVREAGFASLLQPIPATAALLQELADQYNAYHHSSYPLATLDNLGLNLPTPLPALNDLAADAIPLLTTPTFVVGTSDGQYDDFACIEMDDALIGRACNQTGTEFAFVRNISDPVQNAALPPTVQGDWGSAVYQVFGLYTSFNGALLTWAILDAAAPAAGTEGEIAMPGAIG